MDDDLKAEILTLLDDCKNGIETAICNDDGLDGKIGQNIIGQIREMQSRLMND